MTDEERAKRIHELRQAAKAGHDQALIRGPGWIDYARIVLIAEQMEAEAHDLAAEALQTVPRFTS